MAPPWLASDAMNGKSATDLKAVRSMTMWASIYLRYMPMAVAVGQLSMPSALAYMTTIMKLGETERLAKSHGWIAIQYDQAIRKSWARRIQQNDPELDIPRECVRINEDVLEAVRVQAAAAVVPAQRGSSSTSGAAAPSASIWADTAAEGAFAKVGAAAQAMTRRAEAASRELSRAELSLSAREEAMHGQTVAGGKHGKGGKSAGGKGGKAKQWQKQTGGHKRKWHPGY